MNHLNLTRQLTVLMAVLILLTASISALPAYLIIRNELEHQTWLRVQDARQNSQVMLDFERAQLEKTVTLASQRPTLRQLLQANDVSALNQYLTDFQVNTTLDDLYVQDEAGQMLAGVQPDEAVLRMQVALPVTSVKGTTITGVLRLDDDLAERLHLQTGFSYDFLPATAVSSESSPSENGFQRIIDGKKYYGDRLLLTNLTGEQSAIMEILLPVEGVLALEGETIVLLLVVMLGVTLVTSLAGGYYIRSLIRPVRRLTIAARDMGQGDLVTPIRFYSNSPETHTLSQVLEQSRVHLAQTLNELSRAKEWSEALIRSITEGIITFDSAGKVVFFSAGAAEITRIPVSEAVGQEVNTILLPDEAQGMLLDDLPAEGAYRTARMRLRDGQAITVALTRARYLTDDLTTIVLRDITAEAERRSLQAYFLANVSHEFRTPLAGMKVSIELLLENARYLSPSEMNELFNSLYLSVSSLQSLIDNLLESSKIEANHLSLRRQSTEINQVLSEAIRLTQPFLNRRQQVLTLEEPLALPVMSLDQIRLTQVVVNLLSNASKYSPMAAPIEITVDRQEQALYVGVADRGPGIPEMQREGIFRQFVRLNNGSKVDHGTGLGLAVVKAIVEAHGGLVGVAPRQGGGSIFWFTLPVAG